MIRIARLAPCHLGSLFSLAQCSRHIIIRQYSDLETDKAKNWLKSFSVESIPKKDFDISFSRSSGAGGQHVNKVSTKALIKLEADQWKNAVWVPEIAKQQLVSGKFRFLTKSGSIVVQSELTRSRQSNLDDCFDKLYHAIKNGVYFESEPDPEDIKKWKDVKAKTERKRIESKKARSDKKSARKMSKNDY